MLGRRAALLLFLALALAPPAALAQVSPDLERQYTALYAAWDKAPLAVRNAGLMAEKPVSFGQFTPAPSDHRTADKPLIVYAELVGYAWGKRPDGMYAIGVAVDATSKAKDGQTLLSKPNFLNSEALSRNRNLEFYLILTVELTNAPPGDYVIEWRTRDQNSAKEVTFRTPFTIIPG